MSFPVYSSLQSTRDLSPVQSSFAYQSKPVYTIPSIQSGGYRTMSPFRSSMTSLPEQTSFAITNESPVIVPTVYANPVSPTSGGASPLSPKMGFRSSSTRTLPTVTSPVTSLSRSATVLSLSQATAPPPPPPPYEDKVTSPVTSLSRFATVLSLSQATAPPPPPPPYEDKQRVKNRRQSVTPVSDVNMFQRQESYKHEALQHMVFSWMRWAPEPDTPCYKSLHEHFPEALPGPAMHFRIQSILESAPYGFKPESTLFGSSVCPDEINDEKGDLIDSMKSVWGHCFPLGGISGAPFVGATGFKAFSHHVPDDGDIILVYGPHVAVSSEGEIGKCLREGQGKLSSACGAVVGAYSACCADGGKCQSDAVDEYDMQMGWIKRQLAPHTQRIQSESTPMAALAYQAYEMVNAKLEKIVNNDFGSGRLVLIGGIQLNMPAPFKGHFLPMRFEVRQKGLPSQNLVSCFHFRTEEPGAQGFYNGFLDN